MGLMIATAIICGLVYVENGLSEKSNVTGLHTLINSSTPVVNVSIDGSQGPLRLPVGSYFQLSWTSQNVVSCSSTGWTSLLLLDPFPTSGSSTEEWGDSYSTAHEYQVTCWTQSGQSITDGVEVETDPLEITITGNSASSSPELVSPFTENALLALFTVRVGAVGTYLSDIDVSLSQNIVSGTPNLPFSLKALVLSDTPPNQTWFVDPSDYGPSDGHNGGPGAQWNPDLTGLVWLPPNDTTTIQIYGDVGDAQLGEIYKAPIGISLLGGGDLNTLFQLDNESAISRFWSNRPVGGYPIPGLSRASHTAVFGQDIEIVR